MTKELVISIPELPYPHEVIEDSDEDKNNQVPRLSQAFYRLSQDQEVDRYTQRVESIQHDCKTTLDQAQGQLLTLEYMPDLDNLQKGYRDTVTPGGVELTPEQIATPELSSLSYCEISLDLNV